MNRRERDDRGREGNQGKGLLEVLEVARRPDSGDLVVDLSEVRELDVAGLAVLLTAQQKAEEEHRHVWLTGVPMGFWQALHAMGLGRLFRVFPVSGEVAV